MDYRSPENSDCSIIDNLTGEVISGYNYGDTITPKEEKDRRKQERDRRLEYEIQHTRLAGEKYYFVNKVCGFCDISPAMVTRLIYLSTYLPGEYKPGECRPLMLTERTKMRRADLQALLELSKRSTDYFWNEVSPQYISENEEGNLIMNGEVFKRGKLKKKSGSYQQFYVDGVRKLYRAANGKHHKQLGYLFSMLPYISIEYNLLCWNPQERDIEKVELMSMAEFCREIHYDLKHIDRLKWVYNEVRFDVKGRQERFCTMIYNGIDDKNAIICINPNILYSGSNQGRLDVSKLYFRD